MTISRVTRTKKETKASYNRLSRWYDMLTGSSERKYCNLGLDILAAKPEEKVLEIGFGTGHALQALAEAVGASGKVYGIDLSDGMLAISKLRLRKAGLETGVELCVGDALQLPFEGVTFDAIFISFTLELFDSPEIPLVLEQCKSRLRPGGRMVVVALAKSDEPGLAERIYEWFHAKLPTAVDCRPIYARNSLVQAGFEIQTLTRLSMWGLAVEIICGRVNIS